MGVDLSKLIQLLGDTGVLRDEDVLARPNAAWGAGSCPARAIIRADATETLSQAMALCYQNGQTMVPLGGLTGLVNGMTCAEQDVGISLERMNQIEDFDTDTGIMTVQAGVPLQLVQETASGHGWLFPVDLGARGSATIGGMISTNAGGNSVIRYGMMRQQVLGLEAVLADGQILSSMNHMLKNNTGYDLKQLFIGSEGTLGIVTRAVLKLQPVPKTTYTAMVVCDSFTQVRTLLALAVAELSSSLTAFEAMWGAYYDLNVVLTQRNAAVLQPHQPFYILLETRHSEQTSLNPLEQFLGQQLENGVISDAVIAGSIAQTQQLWAIRDYVEAKVIYYKPVAGYDISLPIDAMETYIERLEAALHELDPEINLVVFGHLGDGNLHLGIGPTHNPTSVDKLVYTLLADYRGSISAEHGIGLTKKPYLPLSRSDSEIEIMRRIKRALDPNGLLNPGKVFDQ